MLKETATVISTSEDRAKVAIMRSEACGNCPAKSMCSSSSGNVNVLEVGNPVNARPGQKVVIELQPKNLVRATALVYLLPALSMVSGATLVWTATGSDPGAMVGALGGFLIVTLFLYLHGRREKPSSGPVISRLLPKSDIGAMGQTDRSYLQSAASNPVGQVCGPEVDVPVKAM